jgi:hypothetical protein
MTSMLATDIKIGDDNDSKVGVGVAADEIHFYAGDAAVTIGYGSRSADVGPHTDCGDRY